MLSIPMKSPQKKTSMFSETLLKISFYFTTPIYYSSTYLCLPLSSRVGEISCYSYLSLRPLLISNRIFIYSILPRIFPNYLRPLPSFLAYPITAISLHFYFTYLLDYLVNIFYLDNHHSLFSGFLVILLNFLV